MIARRARQSTFRAGIVEQVTLAKGASEMGPGPTVVPAFPLVHNSYRWREATKGPTVKRESVFRSIIAALLISAMSISSYHRHKADKAGGEKISLEEEGLPT